MKIDVSYRLGAIVPPANPTCEIEYPLLKPQACVLHVARLPVLPGDLADRNKGYVSHYKNAIKSFGSLAIDGVIIGLTGPQYRLGAQADSDLCKALSDEFGFKVETASQAILNTLRRKNIEKISLVSPYPNWLTEFAKAYWTEAGFSIEEIYKFGNELSAYRLTVEEVLDALASIDINRTEAIVMSGTGMRTLDAIANVKDKVPIPILSSNLCSIESIFFDSDLTRSNLLNTIL